LGRKCYKDLQDNEQYCTERQTAFYLDETQVNMGIQRKV